MKQERKQTHDKSRREFLQDSTAAGVGIAVAASLPGTVAAADDNAAEASPKGKGYRLTNHILEYYKTLSS